MKSSIFKLTTAVLLVAVISSCTAYKKIPYLKDVETLSQASLDSAAIISEYEIKAKDVLSITVNTATPDAALDFNMPLVPSGLTNLANPSANVSAQITLQNYIVDKDGNINFPILGIIKIAGLTRIEAEKKIHDMIYPRYLKEDPIVNVRSLSFSVAVLGEVTRPGVYSTTNDKMSIFDALAQAGDLTIFGRRNNVMLIRENGNGQLSVHRINLQDKNLILNNEIYYLQPNDKLYVEPNNARGNSSSIGSLETVGLSAVSVLISLVSLIVVIKK